MSASTQAQDELRDVAARFALGGLVNAVDEVAKRHGMEALPPGALRMSGEALALLRLLGLEGGMTWRVSDVWAGRP